MAFTWRSRGFHMQGGMWRNLIGLAVRGVRLVRKKSAVTVRDVFGSSGVQIESSKKVRVPGFKDKRCEH